MLERISDKVPAFPVHLQAASKRDAVRAAVMAADPSGEGHLSSEQLELALGTAGLKFTRHQVGAADNEAGHMLSGSVRIGAECAHSYRVTQ